MVVAAGYRDETGAIFSSDGTSDCVPEGKVDIDVLPERTAHQLHLSVTVNDSPTAALRIDWSIKVDASVIGTD